MTIAVWLDVLILDAFALLGVGFVVGHMAGKVGI